MLSSFFLWLALSPQLPAEEVFKLGSVDGKEYSPLVLESGHKANVLFFVSPYCPTSNKFMPEINQIIADHESAFGFYLVHSDADIKPADIMQHREMFAVKAAVLTDDKQLLAKQMQAKITPEVVVIGKDGKPLYQGRINDLYLGPTKRQRQATTKDLRDALAAIQAGKEVAEKQTEAVGCKITGLN